MSNKDIFIIITRMTGRPSEFKDYFGNNGIVYVVLDNNYKVKSSEEPPDNLDDVQLIFFRGEANRRYDKFCNFLESNQRGKTFNIAYHEGATPTKQTNDFLNKIKKLGRCIVSYSSRSHQFTTIKDLGECIGKLFKGTECEEIKNKCEEVKKYIKDSCSLDILAQILHLFLPLDIDMQALSDKKVDKEAYLEDMARGLNELYSSEEYKDREKSKHYCQKLYKFRDILNEESLKDKGDLRVLAGLNESPEKSQIHIFFESLDKRMNGQSTSIDFCKPFNLEFKGNKIETFHHWYCALAECLRGEKACEGE